MEKIAHHHPTGQELIHFFDRHNQIYTAFIESPGQSSIPFSEPRYYDDAACFIIGRLPLKDFPPGGYRHIPTVNEPRGSLQVFALAALFALIPTLKNQPRSAVLYRDPHIEPDPDPAFDSAILTITEPWPPADPDPQPVQPPEEKPSHLQIFKPKSKAKQSRPRLKLYWIPQNFYNSAAFQGLKRADIEAWRILRTHAKQSKGGRKFHYASTGLNQLCSDMKLRKEDLLSRCTPKERPEIDKIRFSHGSVWACKERLCRRGLLRQVATGVPKSYRTGQAYVSKYLVAVSEKQRIMLREEAKEHRQPSH